MSHSFGVRVGSPLARSVVDPGLPDLVWYGGEEPPDPLEPGSWAMFRAGVSTRITNVTFESGHLSISLPSAASVEDCELGFDILRRAGAGEVETEIGTMPVADFEAEFGDDWPRFQLSSAARVSVILAREQGLMSDRACVVPRTDRLAVRAAQDDIFLVPREALTALPAQVTWLDDGNQLLEAIPESDWFSFCAVARVHAI